MLIQLLYVLGNKKIHFTHFIVIFTLLWWNQTCNMNMQYEYEYETCNLKYAYKWNIRVMGLIQFVFWLLFFSVINFETLFLLNSI